MSNDIIVKVRQSFKQSYKINPAKELKDTDRVASEEFYGVILHRLDEDKDFIVTHNLRR